jgi:flagellar biosynthesis protein
MINRNSANHQKPINKKAVTLFYNASSPTAPIVTAKGEEALAHEILAIAKEHDIPVFENPGLASFLNTLELGEEIPRVLYVTIAEIIVFSYSLR